MTRVIAPLVNIATGVVVSVLLAACAPVASSTTPHGNLYIKDGLASVYRIDPQEVLTLFAGVRS